MKTLIIMAFGLCLMASHVTAQDSAAKHEALLKSALRRDLSKATEIALIERVKAGTYKVIKVYRGCVYVGGSEIFLGQMIRSDMTDEPRLLVWEESYIGDFNGTVTISLSVQSIPLSSANEVMSPEGPRIPLADVLTDDKEKQNKAR